MKKINLELGGGHNPLPNFINIDRIKEADYSIDLESESLPFKDESVDEIYSNHTFEHIDNIIFVMNECWRVMKWNTKLKIIVPHKDCILAWQDPTHKRYFVEDSIKYFCGEYLKKYNLDYGINCCFKLKHIKVTAPDNRPRYFKQIEFCLEKNKEHFQKINYPILSKCDNAQTETEKEILNIIKKRQEKGRKTYGCGISYKQKGSCIDWVNEAIEESADMLQYLIALKLKLQEDGKYEKNK